MRIKEGVFFVDGRQAMLVACIVVKEVCEEFGVECVVTGGVEEHEPPSKHCTGSGLDFRTRDLSSQSVKEAFTDRVIHRLGRNFDVILESHHLHVEYDA